MSKKEQNVQNALAAVNTLTADERAQFVNILNRLQVESSDEQYFTNVTKAMQAAGWNPAKRIVAGFKASIRNKMEGTKGTNSPRVARMLRLFGQDKTALWIDRFFGSTKPKKVKLPKPGEQEEATAGSETAEEAATTGALVGISSKLDAISVIVGDTRKDVGDIKSMLMPKGVVAYNKSGEHRFVQFNPLAPEGEQFQVMSATGKLMPIKPSKEHKEDAAKAVAKEAAESALRIMKEDREREELKKKGEFKEKQEQYKEEDPLTKVNERLDNIEKKLDNKKEDSIFGMITMLIGGLLTKFKDLLSLPLKILGSLGKAVAGVARAIASVATWAAKFGTFVIKHMWGFIRSIGTGIANLLARFGLTIPGFLAGSAAVATTAAIAAAIDKGMKQGADKAIDGVLTDVTKNIKQSGFEYSDEQKYEMYKDAMDKSMESEDAKRPGRAEYREQQWQLSEGLSDEEKAMARRYFYEKQGGSKGPSTRGGKRRPRQESIPAEILAEGSDTVDTNYADLPVSKPSVGQTGTLTTSTYEERLKALGDIIASGESKGDYNIYNKGTVGKNAGKIGRTDFSKMTIAEYLRRGALSGDDPNKIFAMGKYQIIPETMAAAVEKLGLDENTTLGPETQEYIFREFLTKSKRPAIHKYLTGQSSDINAALMAMAQEWASVGVPYDTMRGNIRIRKGESYYSGVGGNKAHTSPEKISSVITPASTINGSMIDQQNREMQAATTKSAASVAMVSPTVVNNTTVQNVPRRPLAKADTFNKDDTFVREAGRSVIHPSLTG